MPFSTGIVRPFPFVFCCCCCFVATLKPLPFKMIARSFLLLLLPLCWAFFCFLLKFFNKQIRCCKTFWPSPLQSPLAQKLEQHSKQQKLSLLAGTHTRLCEVFFKTCGNSLLLEEIAIFNAQTRRWMYLNAFSIRLTVQHSCSIKSSWIKMCACRTPSSVCWLCWSTGTSSSSFSLQRVQRKWKPSKRRSATKHLNVGTHVYVLSTTTWLGNKRCSPPSRIWISSNGFASLQRDMPSYVFANSKRVKTTKLATR